jgi:hypothetical protein
MVTRPDVCLFQGLNSGILRAAKVSVVVVSLDYYRTKFLLSNIKTKFLRAGTLYASFSDISDALWGSNWEEHECLSWFNCSADSLMHGTSFTRHYHALHRFAAKRAETVHTKTNSERNPSFLLAYSTWFLLVTEFMVVVCTLFNDAFSVSQTIQRRFLLNPDSSAI